MRDEWGLAIPDVNAFDRTPIAVKSKTWQKQHGELWDALVPANGAAMSQQGEVIRITGKLSREALENRNINFDSDMAKMWRHFAKLLCSTKAFDAATKSEVKALVKKVLADRNKLEQPKVAFDRLCELAVRWVLANPVPIPLGPVTYDR